MTTKSKPAYPRAPNQGGVGAKEPPIYTSPRSLRSICDELQMFQDYRAPNHDVWALTENALRVEWLETQRTLKIMENKP